MNDDGSIINFEQNRKSAEADNRARCARCKKFIFMHDVKCEHCGMHFNGEAWQFSPSTKSHRSASVMGIPRWLMVLAAIALLAVMFLAYF